YRCGHLKLWELSTARCLGTLEGHKETVRSVCLSRDGCFALSTAWYDPVRLWTLDWELEDKQPADWDEGARPYLENFLRLRPAAADPVPKVGWLRRLFGRALSEEERSQALIGQGKPSWTEAAFQRLLHTLGCVGYGWLRPEGVRRELEKMAADWSE